MTNHTARMAALLGELRREMNGAVAESMQRGEGGYGLNYLSLIHISEPTRP